MGTAQFSGEDNYNGSPLQIDKHLTSCMEKYKTPALLLICAVVPHRTLAKLNFCQCISYPSVSAAISHRTLLWLNFCQSLSLLSLSL